MNIFYSLMNIPQGVHKLIFICAWCPDSKTEVLSGDSRDVVNHVPGFPGWIESIFPPFEWTKLPGGCRKEIFPRVPVTVTNKLNPQLPVINLIRYRWTWTRPKWNQSPNGLRASNSGMEVRTANQSRFKWISWTGLLIQKTSSHPKTSSNPKSPKSPPCYKTKHWMLAAPCQETQGILPGTDGQEGYLDSPTGF